MAVAKCTHKTTESAKPEFELRRKLLTRFSAAAQPFARCAQAGGALFAHGGTRGAWQMVVAQCSPPSFDSQQLWAAGEIWKGGRLPAAGGWAGRATSGSSLFSPRPQCRPLCLSVGSGFGGGCVVVSNSQASKRFWIVSLVPPLIAPLPRGARIKAAAPRARHVAKNPGPRALSQRAGCRKSYFCRCAHGAA